MPVAKGSRSVMVGGVGVTGLLQLTPQGCPGATSSVIPPNFAKVTSIPSAGTWSVMDDVAACALLCGWCDISDGTPAPSADPAMSVAAATAARRQNFPDSIDVPLFR